MTAKQRPLAGNQGGAGDGVNVGNSLPNEPQPDPLCGRCGGPAGHDGAWCNNCIRECKEYTRRLDGEVAL